MDLDKNWPEIVPKGIKVHPQFSKIFKEISGWEIYSNLLSIQQKAFLL